MEYNYSENQNERRIYSDSFNNVIYDAELALYIYIEAFFPLSLRRCTKQSGVDE